MNFHRSIHVTSGISKLESMPAMSQPRCNASASDAEARDCTLLSKTKPCTDWSVTCVYWDLCEKSKKNIPYIRSHISATPDSFTQRNGEWPLDFSMCAGQDMWRIVIVTMSQARSSPRGRAGTGSSCSRRPWQLSCS